MTGFPGTKKAPAGAWGPSGMRFETKYVIFLILKAPAGAGGPREMYLYTKSTSYDFVLYMICEL